MQLLAEGDLVGLDPMQKTTCGSTPNEIFKLHRDTKCTIIRKTLTEEEKAWRRLLESACRQNDIDPKIVDAASHEEIHFVDAAERPNECLDGDVFN